MMIIIIIIVSQLLRSHTRLGGSSCLIEHVGAYTLLITAGPLILFAAESADFVYS
jgi:hypothetical protein